MKYLRDPGRVRGRGWHLAIVFWGATLAHGAPVTILSRINSPREFALGGCSAALGSDASLVWQSPAAIVDGAHPQALAGGTRGTLGDGQGQFLLASPLGDWGGAFGVAFYDSGKQVLFSSDGQTREVTAQSDWLTTVAFGRALPGRSALAIAANVLSSNLLGEFHANAIAFDGGFQARADEHFQIGVGFNHVGASMRYLVDPVPLPGMLRAGISSSWSFDWKSMAGTVMILGEGERDLVDRKNRVKCGVELQAGQSVALRLGARSRSVGEQAVFSGGVGIRVRSVRVDYAAATAPVGFQSPNTLSIIYYF